MDTLPSSKVLLLKVPWSPQTAPPSADQMLKHMGLSGTFHIQTVTTQITVSFFFFFFWHKACVGKSIIKQGVWFFTKFLDQYFGDGVFNSYEH